MKLVLAVTFTDSYTSKRYNYIHEGDAEPGDYAIVRVSGVAKLVTVREVRKYRVGDAWLKTAVGVVSLEAERKVERLRAERKAITDRLDELLKTTDKLQAYQRLAFTNLEAADLLSRLERL